MSPESPFSRQQKLGEILELPVEEVEPFIIANVDFCTSREQTAVIGYYGIRRQQCITRRALGEQFGGITGAAVGVILKRAVYKLRILASAERASADPLQQNTEQFFNPRRARQVEVPERVWFSLLHLLSGEFPMSWDRIAGVPKMSSVVQKTEREMLLSPRLGPDTLRHMKAMLATAGLRLGMEIDLDKYE